MREYVDRLGYKPRKCVWELTLACNASCLHCGSHAGRPRDREMTTQEALRVARDIATLGCEQITLSGGEPLLRRDWPLIAETLAAGGVRVGMISNGLAFGAAEARLAVASGVEHIAFSVDGLERSHDAVRNRAGAFRRVAQSFEAASAAGLPTCAVTHVSRWNLEEVGDMHVLLGGLGVRSWQVQVSCPTGEMAGHRDAVLQPKDLLRLVPLLADLKRRARPFVEPGDNVGYFGPFEEALRASWRKELPCWTGCYAGCRVVGIESGGNVKGCLALPSERHGTTDFVEGNVLCTPLADIWARPGAFSYNRSFEPRLLAGFCRTCPYGAICRGGCHFTALAYGGTLYDNPLCYYRASMEAASGLARPLRRFVRGLAPAAIVALLGVSACYESYWEAGDAPGADAVATEDDGGTPPDADLDAPADLDEADARCPTYEEGCRPIDPVPIPPGCPPCIVTMYGDPTPAPDATDAPATPDGSACPDPCAPCNIDMYGVEPPPPPGCGPYPPGCPYECGGADLCPTEAICAVAYGTPEIPPECEDPCAPVGDDEGS